MLVCTGWYLYLRGEYKAAEKVVRMSVEVREKMRGREHPDTHQRRQPWAGVAQPGQV